MIIKAMSQSGRTLLHRVSIREASTTVGHWDLVTGVCVERMPLVTAPLSELESRYKTLLDKIEIERSLKSDHELRSENDKIQAELMKADSANLNIDSMSKITTQDFEDAYNEEFLKFKLPSVETEADKKYDKTSLNRTLQRHLVLVTEHKLGSDIKMLLPQGVRKEGETLRQTAERVLKEHCGSNLKVQFFGNAPCGFYKYKYPSEINRKIGAKVFFYYAKYQQGNIEEKNTKYEWLTRKELDSLLPERYHKGVTDFLITERY